MLTLRTIEEFFEFVFREEGELWEGETEAPAWMIVPEGYSPRKTFRGFLRFTFDGERDPNRLYDKLPDNNYSH